MKYLLYLAVIFSSFACQEEFFQNAKDKRSVITKEGVSLNNTVKSIDLDSLWDFLAYEEGGCLTGGQYVKDGKFGGRLCVMTEHEKWDLFFKNDKEELTDFLINKLSDTTKTTIHTCPFFEANTGELAIYALQNIYKINWYDFNQFIAYKDSLAVNAKENQQAWLQAILQDQNQRRTLINYWESL